MVRLACLALASAALLAPAAAQAATITQTGTTVSIAGLITPGDSFTLYHVLEPGPGKLPATTVSLNSPGGLVNEGQAMGDMIRGRHLAGSVPDGATCSSACFMLFSAGETRTIGQGVRIGIHSARLSDQTIDDGAGTLFMARYVAKMGAPASIVGRMVETESRGMDWLSGEDLAGMVTATATTAAAPSSTTPSKYVMRNGQLVALDEPPSKVDGFNVFAGGSHVRR